MRIRWGLVGCGDISRRRVAPALRDSPLCELVAVSRAKAEHACRSSNVKLGVAYYRHFYPVVRRVKELIDSGELGVASIEGKIYTRSAF